MHHVDGYLAVDVIVYMACSRLNYFRTEDEKLYVFALDHKQEFVFEQVGMGAVGVIKAERYTKNEVELCLMKHGEEIQVGIAESDGNNLLLDTFKVSIKIKEAGIFCKTYHNCKDIIVHFADWRTVELG